MKNLAFKSFTTELYSGYNAFILEQALFLPKNETELKYNDSFWGTVQQSLIFQSLGTLAKLTELSEFKGKQTITISSLLNYKLHKYNKTITKIKNWRNNIGFHKNLDASLNIKSFYAKLGLTRKDVELLYKQLFIIIDELKNDFKNSRDFKADMLRIETNIQEQCDDIIIKIKKVQKFTNNSV